MKREFKQTITATELKNNLGKYLDHVSDNNEVVITKNGTKAIRLSPYITDYDQYNFPFRCSGILGGRS